MDTVLRAMIVDDEAPARESLQRMLAAHPNVKVVAEANSVANAAALYLDLKPDVIFLDVQMPTGDGFSLLPKLQPIPSVIFVTAYDEYAVRAFEVNAIDYLLKPVRGDRLSEAIQRILHQPKIDPKKPLMPEDRIFLRSDSTMRVVHVDSITGIEAEGNYSRVHVRDGSSIFMRRRIAEWDAILPKPMFLPVSRSLLLNLRAVDRVSVKSRDQILVQVVGFSVPVILSRRAYHRLREALREQNLV